MSDGCFGRAVETVKMIFKEWLMFEKSGGLILKLFLFVGVLSFQCEGFSANL